MKKRVLQTIKEHNLIEEGMHIVIGLSGGPDSVCLFDVLVKISEEMKLKLYPVHVNHKFRPGAAEEDQAYVEKLCREKKVECTSFVVDCNKMARDLHMTSEEAGRKARYDAFKAVANEIAAAGVSREKIAIAIAQNAEDQCETILFRIMRGTGIDGLAGIPYKRLDEDGNMIIRPILDVSRNLIEEYCHENKLNPRIDGTNNEPIYTRNKIRLGLIPYIKENFNENITETVNRLGRSAGSDKEYMNMEAEKAFREAKCGDGEKLRREVLLNLHPSIRVRVYNMALKYKGLNENITTAHLDGLEKVLFSQSPSAMYSLPGGVSVRRDYDFIIIEDGDKGEDVKPRIQVISCGEISADKTPLASFSKEAIEAVYGKNADERIVVRHREPGDFMYLKLGENLHRKKIQDMLVDMKVPKSKRDEIWMVAIGKEILCILPKGDANLEKYRFTAAYRPLRSQDEDVIILEKL